MKEKYKTKVYHRPDWHPMFNSFLGDIIGDYGYVTEVGTIALLGPNPQKKTFIPEEKTKTETAGPLLTLSAAGGLF